MLTHGSAEIVGGSVAELSLIRHISLFRVASALTTNKQMTNNRKQWEFKQSVNHEGQTTQFIKTTSKGLSRARAGIVLGKKKNEVE